MNQQEIITIPIFPMGMISAFLIASPDGYVLVDSGVPGSEGKIVKGLKKHGLTFEDITLIVITHAHGDHAGNASKLRELCQAPLLAHEADLPYYLRERDMEYCPTGWFGRLFLKTGVPLRSSAFLFSPTTRLRQILF